MNKDLLFWCKNLSADMHVYSCYIIPLKLPHHLEICSVYFVQLSITLQQLISYAPATRQSAPRGEIM